MQFLAVHAHPVNVLRKDICDCQWKMHFLCFYTVIFEMEVFDLDPILRMQHVEAPITSLAVPRKSVAAGLGGLQVDNTWQCCTGTLC